MSTGEVAVTDHPGTEGHPLNEHYQAGVNAFYKGLSHWQHPWGHDVVHRAKKEAWKLGWEDARDSTDDDIRGERHGMSR